MNPGNVFKKEDTSYIQDNDPVFQKGDHYHIHDDGHLFLHNTDLVSLARLSTRPIYVLDEVRIHDRIHDYKDALSQYYPGSSRIYYASKALQNLSICVLMQQEGIGFDVCSIGEIYVASQAGVPFSNMIFHGNNKSEEELLYAIQNGVHRIIIDSEDEAEMISEITQKLQKKCSVLVRLNPEIVVSSHKHITTGVKLSKFGLPVDEKTMTFISRLNAHPLIDFRGIHYHLGSQLFVLEEYSIGLSVMLGYLHKLKKTHNIVCQELNIGGGIGVRYTPQDNPIPIDTFIKRIATELVELATAYELPLPHLMLEPGRSLVCDAGCTIYKVGVIKKVSENLIYAAVNGGMTDNIRPALYQAKYTAVVANKMHDPYGATPYKIVGKCCESGDVLIENIQLPLLERNDTLVVFSTGAYNYTLADNSNKHTLPGIILVNEQGYKWIVKEQPLEDLIRYDL